MKRCRTAILTLQRGGLCIFTPASPVSAGQALHWSPVSGQHQFALGCSPGQLLSLPKPACTSSLLPSLFWDRYAVTTITGERGRASPQLQQGQITASPVPHVPQAITYPHAPAPPLHPCLQGLLLERGLIGSTCPSHAVLRCHGAGHFMLSGRSSFPAYR